MSRAYYLHVYREGRRDKRGRRIGYNWWRDYITDLLHCADAAWQREAEKITLGYDTEMAEYAALHPRPNLKQFLIEHAGMHHVNHQPAA